MTEHAMPLVPEYGFLFDGEATAIGANTLAAALAWRPDLSAARLIEVWHHPSGNAVWEPSQGPWQDPHDPTPPDAMDDHEWIGRVIRAVRLHERGKRSAAKASMSAPAEEGDILAADIILCGFNEPDPLKRKVSVA